MALIPDTIKNKNYCSIFEVYGCAIICSRHFVHFWPWNSVSCKILDLKNVIFAFSALNMRFFHFRAFQKEIIFKFQLSGFKYMNSGDFAIFNNVGKMGIAIRKCSPELGTFYFFYQLQKNLKEIFFLIFNLK